MGGGDEGDTLVVIVNVVDSMLAVAGMDGIPFIQLLTC